MHVQQALELAEASGDRSTMARALDALGTLTIFGEPEATRPEQRRCLTLARESGDESCVADATQILAYSYTFQSRHAEALAIAEEALPLIEAMGYREFQAWHWCLAAHGNYETASWDACEEHCERAIAAARAVGEPVSDCVAQLYLGQADLLRGRTESALERLRRASERAVREGAGMAVAPLTYTLAAAEIADGQDEPALRRLQPLVASGLDGGTMLSVALATLAQVHDVRGEAEAAASTASQAVQVAARIDCAWALGLAHLTLAAACLARESFSEADAHVHDALEAILERGLVALMPDALELLAGAALGLHSDEEAARLLGAAAAARTAHELASPRRRAEWVAAHEDTLGERLGAETLARTLQEGGELEVRAALAWARRARGERKRPPGGWESLTPTELEVVRHASSGLTNPQIGEQMFITRGTVKVHLSHIYAKLGLRNRSGLAAEAARREI